ncbi:MAG: amidohydrolase [Butyrivibrio sp.]|nr:amidohydrolase [Acetatifactor muris]MCM1558563.1 amidohydrolase [Butyrivibrio sp.]
MNIRLYNARILTMEKNRPVFSGEVWVKNDKIAYVADREELQNEWNVDVPRITWDVEVDCRDNLLMPGFKDAHTHSAMTFLRSYADDVPLKQWLNEKVFPMEAKLTEEDIYHLTRLAILEYLTSGITSVFEMYLNPGAAAEACIDMGMRCVLTSGLNNFSSSVEQMEAEYLKWNKANPLISYQLGFHAEYTCSKELIYRISQLAHRYHAPVYTHLAETKGEVEECKERYGMTPAMFLDTMGIFEYGGGAYHCVHMTEEDMELFRRRRLFAVTNPASNMKLASGIAPVAEFEKRKIPVAIGTDGPASNNCLDMFREMFLVTGLSKLREEDAASLDAMKVLRMATVNGAKAMRLAKADVLAKGKLADLILLDLHQPNMQPIHNIPKNLVYSGSKSNVLMTMINGRILYRNGEFNIGESVEDIYAKCDRIAKRILYA